MSANAELQFVRIKTKAGSTEAEVTIGNGQPLSILEAIELLQKNFTAFEGISISHFDGDVLTLLHHLHSKLDCHHVNLAIETYNTDFSEQILDTILPLIQGVLKSIKMDAKHIENLTQLAPSLLCECPLLHSIATNKFSLEFTAKDGAPIEGQALAKWLHIANPEGLPKMIDFCYNANGLWTINKSEEMKDSFYLAKTSANFIVRLYLTHDEEDGGPIIFDITNAITMERLKMSEFAEDRFLLVRSPIDRDENEWAKWEKKAKEWDFDQQRNTITICENDEENDDEDGKENDEENDEEKDDI